MAPHNFASRRGAYVLCRRLAACALTGARAAIGVVTPKLALKTAVAVASVAAAAPRAFEFYGAVAAAVEDAAAARIGPAAARAAGVAAAWLVMPTFELVAACAVSAAAPRAGAAARELVFGAAARALKGAAELRALAARCRDALARARP